MFSRRFPSFSNVFPALPLIFECLPGAPKALFVTLDPTAQRQNLTHLLLQQDRWMNFTTCANAYSVTVLPDFDVLLTVHLSIFILIINQLDAQNLFYDKFISCLYVFRAPFAHRQEVKIVLYSLWYQHTL